MVEQQTQIQTDASQGVSLLPETFQEGGLWEGNGLLYNPKFIVWDYNGRLQNGQRVVTLAVRAAIIDDQGKARVQFFSAGSAADFAPSPDGSRAIPQAGKQFLNKNTNLAEFLTELVNAGFPANRLTPAISDLHMLYVTWAQKAATKREGLQNTRDNRTVLRPTAIINLPWEPTKHPTQGQITEWDNSYDPNTWAYIGEAQGQGGGQPTGQTGIPTTATVPGAPQVQVPGQPAAPVVAAPVIPAAGAPAAPPAQSTSSIDPAVDATARAYIQRMVATGPQTTQSLAASVFNEAVSGIQATDPNRNKVSALVYDSGYLQGLVGQGVISFDGTNVGAPIAG